MSVNPSSREGHFNPASPHSSSGAADSFKGTPETRLTTFSPDDGSAKSSKASQSLSVRTQENRLRFASTPRGTLELPSSFVRANLHSERDPFVSSSAIGASRTQKLSPTASVFLPYPSVLTNSGQVIEPIGHQRSDSTGNKTSDQQLATQSQQVQFAHNTLSTDLKLSRCLVIDDPRRRLRAHDVGSYLSELETSGLEMHGRRQICEDENGDRIFVRFLNIRDACAAYSILSRAYDRGWLVNYISPSEYAQFVEPEIGRQTIHEGQVYLNVFATGVPIIIEPQRFELTLKRLLQDHGDLFAFKPELTTGAEGSLFSAIAEYCDNDTCLEAVSKFNNTIIEGCFQLCITLYRPDISAYGISSNGMISPARTSTTESDIVHDLQRLNMSRPQSTVPGLNNSNALLSTPVRSPALHMQPTYGMLPILYHGIPMTTPPYVFDNLSTRAHTTTFPSAAYPFLSPMAPRSAYIPRDMVVPRQFSSLNRRQNATRISRSPYYQQTNSHNHVDVNRIREGTDVRTTIMLRNIPNKVDQAMLKRIVDESSWGKYDFMYLRIDFANDCNVGYAFINFVDPLDIIDFVSARGNQRWNCFKSDKVAEISYATIQGKDCLVQKFRNSSVMLEAAHYRPKLYYTLNGPLPDLAGQEEAFPEPDNQSKMKRSCENAEHVGLFTPNAGQHFRDEQRRRRSQFDRGTRMAEAEEFDYDAALHHNFYPA
ncbi:RNA recognition motif 2-domain-containing protein [Xylaria bambusicola]|uniref:RNA recognition motif 2-domain-containing protein n=1 Tax=Xylaria bambusicola TaxID=326684 RepID=UPI002008AF8A|nr:RNA recognition motif 2-domain-containing protein [Xylaria bambusicola]KAI0527860.1 RNA recognition motif 2-domain-containing protein [Xylaria bambusicola]